MLTLNLRPTAAWFSGSRAAVSRRRPQRRVPRLERLESRHLLAASVSDLGLVQDTGVSSTDLVTREPALSGRVEWGSPDTNYAVVEFDHDGDGVPEGSTVVPASGGTFQYDPLNHDQVLAGWEGLLTLAYRVVEYGASGPLPAGSWSPFAFTLDRIAPMPVAFSPAGDPTLDSELASVTATFNEPLAASSLTSTSLTVMSSNPLTLGTLTLSDPLTISASLLAAPLEGTYTTYVSDVSDVAGNTSPMMFAMNWEVMSAPVTSGIADVFVDEDSADTLIPLHDAFADGETSDANLIYAVTGHTNPSLLTPQINQATGQLILDYTPDAYGTTILTVTATDEDGLSIATTFTVTVAPVNDPPRIVEFLGIPGPTVWNFSGRVNDEDPVGLTVTFGGLLNGHSAVVESNGYFYLSLPLNSDGIATARTVDRQGLESNVAWQDVIV